MRIKSGILSPAFSFLQGVLPSKCALQIHWVLWIALVFLVWSCGGDTRQTDVQPISSEEVVSSSSLSDRPIIGYVDTIQLAQDLDSSATPQTLNLPVAQLPAAIYLGHLPVGAVVTVWGSASEPGAQVSVYSERGVHSLPQWPSQEDVFTEYMVLGSLEDSITKNSFIVLDSGYQYFNVEVPHSFTGDSLQLQLLVVADTTAMALVQDSIWVTANGAELPAVALLYEGERDYYVCFEANLGTEVTVKNQGNPVSFIAVQDGADSTWGKASAESFIYKFLPVQDDAFCINYHSALANYSHGYFVYFNSQVFEAELPAGEYLTTADSLEGLGDTLTVSRPANPIAQYDVKYDHYVALGRFTKGDSLLIWYGSGGLTLNQKRLYLLNKAGEPLDTLGVQGLNWLGKTPNSVKLAKDEDLYLHFVSTGGSFADTTQSVRMQAMVQQIGAVSGFGFILDSLVLQSGDTLLPDTISFSSQTNAADTLRSLRYWQIPADQRSVLGERNDIAGTPLLFSDTLRARAAGEAYLIGISAKDPSARDTIFVTVE